MLLTFRNFGVKLLEVPWAGVPRVILQLITEKAVITPDGFDIIVPKKLLGGVTCFLNNEKLFWIRVTHILMEEQCLAIATTYDALQRREVER